MSAGGYTAAERRSLAEAARRGEPLVCPACGHALAAEEIRPRGDVSYVRRRLLLVCPACKRTAAVDARPR